MADPIRAVLLRYVQTVRVCCVLARSSPWSTTSCRSPSSSPPTIRRSRRCGLCNAATSRSSWSGTGPAPGGDAKPRPRPVSVAVAQATVLSLRNLLEDIAIWGWAEAPSRRLVFAADVPKLDRALPRALAPDVDGG